MTFFKKNAFAFVAFLALTACSSSHGKYAAISEQPMTLYTLTKQKVLAAASIENKSSRFVLFSIPFGEEPSLEKAIASTLGYYNGDYLSNAKVTSTSFGIVGICEYKTWKINGDVVRIYQ